MNGVEGGLEPPGVQIQRKARPATLSEPAYVVATKLVVGGSSLPGTQVEIGLPRDSRGIAFQALFSWNGGRLASHASAERHASTAGIRSPVARLG